VDGHSADPSALRQVRWDGPRLASARYVVPSPSASAVYLTKTYGTDEVRVRALDGVAVEFERGPFTGPVGVGQADAHALRPWAQTGGA
jgi:hypothetical protein